MLAVLDIPRVTLRLLLLKNICQRANLPGIAFYRNNFEAIMMVKVYVLGGYYIFTVIVLYVHEFPGQLALVMIVNQGNRPSYFPLRSTPFSLIPDG